MLLTYRKGLARAGLFTLCYLLIINGVFAQKEGNIWTFGYSAGLDFNSGVPVPIMKPVPMFSSLEGTATICNAAGELLMYTNGAEVFDRNGNIMPNGDDLTPVDYAVSSTTQGSVIVPVPGHATRYYLFTLGESIIANGTLSYNIVDMSLNGGLGDVVAGRKRIEIDSLLTEKMTVAVKDCNSAWLMVRSRNANEYKAYEIKDTGINTIPVISAVGNGALENYSLGSIKFSPDGTKMVASLYPRFKVPSNKVALELYDFDRSTGRLSNPLALDYSDSTVEAWTYYSASFSPDNTKLYGSHMQRLVQFDISLPTPAQIIASRTVIRENTDLAWYGGDLKIGPDGKIYVLSPGFITTSYVHRIDYPNLAGTACQLVPNAITLLPGTSCILGLPNEVIKFNYGLDTVARHFDTTLCIATTIGAGENAYSYLWSTGSTDKTITVTTGGSYWVQYVSDCLLHIDSFDVSFATAPEIDLGKDTLICAGAPIQLWLHSGFGTGVAVKWSSGSTEPSIKVTDTGRYWVVGATVPCPATDTIYIGTKHCDCSLRLPTAFSPNGDGLNDIFTPAYSPGCHNNKQYSLKIFNRWGQLVFSSNTLDKGWNGYYKGLPADAGTYFYQLRFYREQEKDEINQNGDVVLIH